MTASTPTTSRQRDDRQSDDDVSTLDRRRDKAQAAKDAAETARAGVAELDARLAANAGRQEQDQTALQHAQDEVIRLKKAIKAATKESAGLQAQRKKARATAAKATAKAHAAEARYDQIVLAEIVRREKDRDRAAAATGTAAPAVSKAAVPVASKAAVPVAGKAATPPAAERPTAGPATSARTAARKTAAAAGRTKADDTATNGTTPAP